MVAGLLVANALAGQPIFAPAAAAGTQPPLLPAPGQFVSVPATDVLNTNTGLGESSAAPLAAGATFTIAVTGSDGVPSGATSVAVDVFARPASGSGFLSAYDPDAADPGVAMLGLASGANSEQTDTVAVSADGHIAMSNHSTGAVTMKVSVVGYFTGQDASSAADTYTGVPWTRIVDTTTGLGTTLAPVAAGASITVQVSGQGGIATGADTAFIQVNAYNATANGSLDVYPAGTTDPGVAALRYASDDTYRNLVYAPLSSSGRLTITNTGTAPVDLAVYTRGYFMPPTASTVGAEYAPISNVMVYGTAGAGQPVAANASVTFQVAGTAGLPATGVSEVAQDVVVTSPAATGTLTIDGSGTTGAAHPIMNFLAGTGTSVGYDNSIVSQVSPTGQETITNTSSGTLNLRVTVIGFFFLPQTPSVPSYLQTTGTDTTTPMLSGIVQDATGDDLTGEIFLLDSAGNPIGGSPTATGQVGSGERVSWPVTDGTLTDGDSYQWYMEACDQGLCSAPTATQTFTVDTAAAPQPPSATQSATITGASVTAQDGIVDPGACSGSDCPLAGASTLKAGNDGTSNWASSLKVDVSAIPAGSEVVSATLQLTESGCLSGTACTAGSAEVSAPDSDVAAASTGPQLAAAETVADTASAGSPAQGSWDVTAAVQTWVGGAPNDGLVIAPAPGAAGVAYYSPSANVSPASLPQITVTYIPPAVPSAPASLTVTPGAAGLLVTWGDASWNYLDTSGNAPASYTVVAYGPSGNMAQEGTTSGNSAVLNYLTYGVPYSVSVTATNSIGTGPAATSAPVAPVPVPDDPSQYVAAVNQFLNGQNALNAGTASTASAALSGMSMAPAISTQLSNEDLGDAGTATVMASHGEQFSADSTTLASTLAMPASDGTVKVFVAAQEAFTTSDTSSGTAISVPGSGTNDYLFTFTGSATSPQMTGYIDADAAFTPVNPDDEQTAFSDILDGPEIAAADSGAPAPLATTPSGFAGGSEIVPDVTAGQGNAAKWAKAHVCPNAPTASACDNYFTDDCTDFASRALAFGGGFPEYWGANPTLPSSKHNLHYWYQYHYSILGYHTAATSSTWARAHSLAEFEKYYGGYFYKYEKTQTNVSSNIKPGALIFGAISKGSTEFAKIDHTGMVTSVAGNNLYITQHSTNYLSRPLWATHKHRSWFNDSNGLLGAVWVTNPVRV
jgi:Putative amidase domain